MKPIKIVVFDLDETLGYFVELSIFWESLNSYIKTEKVEYELDQKDFNEVLDLFEGFIRPNIVSVLNYLKYKKQTKVCNSVLIYTNNQGTKDWALHIQKFFETKINGKKYELCRTSHEKTIHDLLKCSKLPPNTEVCFLDDVLYPEMSGKNIYYIKVNPYVYNIPFDVMIQRFLTSEIGKKIINDKKNFTNYMSTYMSQYAYTYVEKSADEYEIDKIITKKTMFHLQTFFNKHWKDTDTNKNYTNKKKLNTRSKTLKRRNVF